MGRKKKLVELNKDKVSKAKDLYKDYMYAIHDMESFKDAPAVSRSPFHSKMLESLQITHKVVSGIQGMRNYEVINKETGEVTSEIQENKLFFKKDYLDKATFTKIYRDKVRMLFDLTHSAFKVLGYIFDRVQNKEFINKDMINIDINECMDFCGYSAHNMVYRGLTELIKKGFIARSTRSGSFWIDPSAFFNGSRITIMEDYILSGSINDDRLEGKKHKDQPDIIYHKKELRDVKTKDPDDEW